MKRVFGLTVLLISTYVFELLFLYPGNIVDEISYYKPTSQISVTNTTIYNEDIDHYYKVLKQLKEADFESLDKSITRNGGNLIEDYSKSIDLLISEININLLFHNFTKFKESNNYDHCYYFTPTEGRILVFPSHLQHHVLKNKSKEDRISVSFNIKLRK